MFVNRNNDESYFVLAPKLTSSFKCLWFEQKLITVLHKNHIGLHAMRSSCIIPNWKVAQLEPHNKGNFIFHSSDTKRLSHELITSSDLVNLPTNCKFNEMNLIWHKCFGVFLSLSLSLLMRMIRDGAMLLLG